MKRKLVIYSLLVVLLVVLLIVNINLGSIKVSIKEILEILLNQDHSGVKGRIIWEIRLPRVFATFILGGGLALAGYLLQTFFHNPIAGPFVLGISSGAKFMVALLMVASMGYGFFVTSYMMIFAALLGAFFVTFFVLMVSHKVKQMSVLIVCGIMVGYICSAVTELIISFADDANIVNLHSWSMGSFAAISWGNVWNFTPVIAGCLAVSLLISKQMEAYTYDEQYALSVGVNVRKLRVVIILLSSVLSATVTAFAGPISFVGIAVPHVMRVGFRSDRPVVLIPGVFLAGGVFCLLSDFLARNLFAPMELSISTITAVLGAPVVIAMLLKRRARV